MERAFFVVVFKEAYSRLLSAKERDVEPELGRDETRRVVVSLTQGGFAQDVRDDELQVKTRFLEYLFSAEDLDLPRTPEVFNQYFDLEPVDEFIDLDEDY